MAVNISDTRPVAPPPARRRSKPLTISKPPGDLRGYEKRRTTTVLGGCSSRARPRTYQKNGEEMKKLKCADLFCGAGGAAMGLSKAGFEVHGWDIKPQPHYPFEFHLGNALEADLTGFDFVWASPPCQAYTQASLSQRRAGKIYPDLMAATRAKLFDSKLHYIIENTPGAPMRVDIILCGSMFGLRLIRHRWFELSFPFFELVPKCQHHPNPCVVVGHGTTTWARKKTEGSATRSRKIETQWESTG